MEFKINDKVELIDEPIKGRVIAVKETLITILTEEDFEMTVRSNELVRSGDPYAFPVRHDEVPYVLQEKGDLKETKEQKDKKTAKKSHGPAEEVDLHIHELTDSRRGMSNYEILTLQLETAKEKLDFAIQNRLQKVIFIHGVGEGVLRSELEALFKTYHNITYYDADFKRYGRGATEVHIHRNS